jgi:hypothetical protein
LLPFRGALHRSSTWFQADAVVELDLRLGGIVALDDPVGANAGGRRNAGKVGGELGHLDRVEVGKRSQSRLLVTVPITALQL